MQRIRLQAAAAAVVLGLFFPSAPFAQPLAEKVREHRFGNGLRLLMVPRHQSPTFSAYITIGVGAVDETSRQPRRGPPAGAHAVQGDHQHRHPRLPPGEAAAGADRTDRRRSRRPALVTPAPTPSGKAELRRAACGAAARAPPAGGQGRVLPHLRRKRRGRLQCLHQQGPDHLSRLAAGQQAGAVGLPEVGPDAECGAARVLHRARRGDGGAAPFLRGEPRGNALREADGHRLHRPPLPQSGDRLDVGHRSSLPGRDPGFSRQYYAAGQYRHRPGRRHRRRSGRWSWSGAISAASPGNAGAAGHRRGAAAARREAGAGRIRRRARAGDRLSQADPARPGRLRLRSHRRRSSPAAAPRASTAPWSWSSSWRPPSPPTAPRGPAIRTSSSSPPSPAIPTAAPRCWRPSTGSWRAWPGSR